MALNFPDNPASGDTFISGNKTWQYNGNRWVLIAAGAVISVADGSITAAKIADGTIVAAEIAANAVTTAKILDANVTADKISAGAVTAAKINNAVTLNDIPDVTITTTDTYAIGDTGPGGGKIFITPSTAGNSTGKYFEVAPSSAQVSRTWATNVNSNRTTAVSGADGTAIGTGAQNTIDIVAQAGNVAATSAAAYASDYANGGFSDWFLPSKNELNELYTQIAVLSSPQNNYWSSTEDSATTAWYQDFFSGTQYNDLVPKGGSGAVTIYVRPVRSFTAATNSVAVSGQALTWNGTAWVNSTLAAAPKVYVTEYTTYTDTSWTCPAGVTQIKLTLIGSGGAAGDVEAITAGASTSSSFPGDTSASTTFTVGATVYTALGGKKGLNISVTGPAFSATGNYYNSNSSSGSVSGTAAEFKRYPGCGGAPGYASANTGLIYTDNTNSLNHTSRAYAYGRPGQDGVIEVFQVTVVPSTTYSFVIGKAAGFESPTFTTESYMGSNGAVIIEYVV